jgi:hypothetical protein
MQHLQVSGAVRPLKWPLGVKWIFLSLFVIRSFPVAGMGALHVGTVSRVEILAFFNWAIQSLVCPRRCWRLAVRGKSSDFTSDELHAF